MDIEILYSPDCTSWQTAETLLRQALAEMGIEANIWHVVLTTDREAHERGFIGSPSIFVNGSDLFPVPGASSVLRLRSYWTEDGMLDHPTYGMLIAALRQHVSQPPGDEMRQ